MVSGGQLATFAVASFILIVIPGPSVLFVIGSALAYGRRTALASVAGNAAGLEVVAMSVALGIGTLVERSVLVYTAVKLAGAGYLIWEMTAARGTCATCGASRPVAELVVYRQAPGTVVRCRTCGNVLMVFVKAHGFIGVDLAGLASLSQTGRWLPGRP